MDHFKIIKSEKSAKKNFKLGALVFDCNLKSCGDFVKLASLAIFEKIWVSFQCFLGLHISLGCDAPLNSFDSLFLKVVMLLFIHLQKSTVEQLKLKPKIFFILTKRVVEFEWCEAIHVLLLHREIFSMKVSHSKSRFEFHREKKMHLWALWKIQGCWSAHHFYSLAQKVSFDLLCIYKCMSHF